MDWIQPVTVTMLGAPRSGKTTFLLGMYATMSLGERVYAMIEQDQDQDFLLGQAWDRLCVEGVLPPPTPEEPSHHMFTLLHGAQPLLRLSWTDFRGGAMSTRIGDEHPEAFVDSADAKELVARLAVSDSVYLVLDGSVLAGALDGAGNRQGVAQALETRRMTALVRAALLDRAPDRPPMSVLVLLTKTDRLLHGLPGRSAAPQRLDQALEVVLGLLPVIRQPGVTVAVCPVTVGSFGDQDQGVVDPATVNPYWLHKPVMFTVFHRLAVEQDRLAAELRWLEERQRQVAAEREQRAGDRVGRLLRRGELRQLEEEQAALRGAWQEADRRRRMVDYWVSVLYGEVADLPVFRGGRRLAAGESWTRP